jgi:hypothetical protein
MCFGFGFYIYHMHVHFRKQMLFLYTTGIKQIIATKNFEDSGTSIFASGQGRCPMLTVPSSLWWSCYIHAIGKLFPYLILEDILPHFSKMVKFEVNARRRLQAGIIVENTVILKSTFDRFTCRCRFIISSYLYSITNL